MNDFGEQALEGSPIMTGGMGVLASSYKFLFLPEIAMNPKYIIAQIRPECHRFGNVA
jgi:hypothetical protein